LAEAKAEKPDSKKISATVIADHHECLSGYRNDDLILTARANFKTSWTVVK
jgi:hypothetical protein